MKVGNSFRLWDSKKHYKAKLKQIISSLDMVEKWAQMTLIVSHHDSFVTFVTSLDNCSDQSHNT